MRAVTRAGDLRGRAPGHPRAPSLRWGSWAGSEAALRGPGWGPAAASQRAGLCPPATGQPCLCPFCLWPAKGQQSPACARLPARGQRISLGNMRGEFRKLDHGGTASFLLFFFSFFFFIFIIIFFSSSSSSLSPFGFLERTHEGGAKGLGDVACMGRHWSERLPEGSLGICAPSGDPAGSVHPHPGHPAWPERPVSSG